jgi:O-antigen/teichoic acid export membrane protein
MRNTQNKDPQIALTLLRNSGTVAVSNAIALVLAFSAATMVARHLGPKDFGQYSAALAFIGFFSLLPEMGMDSVLTREIAKKPLIASRLLGNLFSLRVILAMCAIGLAFVAGRLWGKSQYERLLIYVAAPYIAVYTLGLIGEVYFKANLSMQIPAVIKMLAKGLLFGGILAGSLLNLKLLPFLLITALIEIPAIGILYIILWRKLRPQICIAIGDWTKVARESWPLALSSLAIMVYTRADVLLLSRMSGSEAVGQYSAAARISEPWSGIGGALAVSLMPLLSRYRSQNDGKSYDRAYRMTFDWALWILIGVCVFFSLYAKDLLQAVYGNRYGDAAIALPWYMWGQIGGLTGLLYSSAMIADGRQRIQLGLVLCSAIINIILNLALIPRFGILGAAVATLVSYNIGIPILMAIRSARHYIVPFFKALTIPAAGGLAMILGAKWHAGNLALSAGMAAIFYIAASASAAFALKHARWRTDPKT